LSFDTRAVNALARRKYSSFVSRIPSRYFTRLNFLSVAEPVATENPGRRHRLFDLLNSLGQNGECLLPPHWIATNLIQNYERKGRSEWESLSLRFKICEEAIACRDFTDEISISEREFARVTCVKFISMFLPMRPELDELFARGLNRPATADELLAMLSGEGGAYWGIAALLYRAVARRLPTEDEIGAFVNECPPFRALMLGLVHGQFEWAIREPKIPEERRVGRVILFCAIYLPYWDLFVTNDREQRRCLAEIAAALNLGTKVIWFKKFVERLGPQEGFSRSHNASN